MQTSLILMVGKLRLSRQAFAFVLCRVMSWIGLEKVTKQWMLGQL